MFFLKILFQKADLHKVVQNNFVSFPCFKNNDSIKFVKIFSFKQN